MNILLIGDFSGMHTFLKQGLEELGHSVTLISNGDGFKRFDSDIFLPTLQSNFGKVIDYSLYGIEVFQLTKKLKNYDVVQLAFDHLFSPVLVNRYVLKRLKNQNQRLFLSLAGSNMRVMRHWLESDDTKLKTLFNDARQYDNYPSQISSRIISHEYEILDLVDGIIPVTYEYQQPYLDHPKLSPIIPIPINTQLFDFNENIVGDKIIFFHGLNKYGFKGTHYIEKAFKIIESKYVNEVETSIVGKMPFSQYMTIMSKANVVLDQTSSHSLGVNGLLALAKGRIVMGGDTLGDNALGYINSPVISLKPDFEFIVYQCEQIIKNRLSISCVGKESRTFVEKFHNHKLIAEQYMHFWLSSTMRY